MVAPNGYSHSSNKALLGWWRQWKSIMIIISGKPRHVISSETESRLQKNKEKEKEEERGERKRGNEKEQDKKTRRRPSERKG